MTNLGAQAFSSSSLRRNDESGSSDFLLVIPAQAGIQFCCNLREELDDQLRC
jgi:hypothetical protein